MAPTINWDYSYGTWRAIIQGCLLFGDPAQRLKSPHPSEPPATPDAPDAPPEWVQDIDCPIKVKTTDPENDPILYLFDWGDGTMSEWLGPYQSNQEVQVSHSYAELVEYQVRVRARDIWGSASDWSKPCTIKIIVNTPPNKPTIDGPKTIKLRSESTYTISAVDPNNHDLYYYVYWGDGDYVNWIGPYSSGETVTVKNSWPEPGKYDIQLKAKDFIGDKSNLTVFTITVTKNRATGSSLLLGFLERFADNFPFLQKILNY
jgi:hypothetical protein